MQPSCADKPVLHLQLYKDNPRPAWWPLPTFDAKELKTRAAMNAVYGALQSRFGELPVRRLLTCAHLLFAPCSIPVLIGITLWYWHSQV